LKRRQGTDVLPETGTYGETNTLKEGPGNNAASRYWGVDDEETLPD